MLEKGDVENIVHPRLEGDLDINSSWEAIEAAMACVSPTSIESPTTTHVVMEIKQCLAMELARRHGGFESDSDQISGIDHTEQTPLAR
ncbi:lrr receptor-like serine/threonine-protein kinase ios1 [Quercus suber]|uniref:Lrr receptor-like serine/threonine-protein kinase ios1 n=1 Tax=Quercus suber TaxID=58331 RepID=A0AAW0M1N6_QUESU|nr:putative lrr receptor-like serine/threonine-protein kinase [Quercus suber]